MHIFFFFRGSLVFGGDVVAAELKRHHVIRRPVNQPLPRLRNRQHHRIGLAIVVGNLAGLAPQEFDNCIVAEVQLISPLQIDHASQRYHARHAGFVRGQTQRQLATGRVSHDDGSLGIKMVALRILQQELIGRADVGECSRPRSAFVAHAPVFQIRRCQPFGGESGTQVASVIEIVFCPPVPAVDMDDQRKQRLAFFFAGWQTQIEKLISIRSIRNARIGGRGGCVRMSSGMAGFYCSKSVCILPRTRGGSGNPILFVAQGFNGIEIGRA